MLSCSRHARGLVDPELFAALTVGKGKKALVFCEVGGHYVEIRGECETLVWARIALAVADTLLKLHPAGGIA